MNVSSTTTTAGRPQAPATRGLSTGLGTSPAANPAPTVRANPDRLAGQPQFASQFTSQLHPDFESFLASLAEAKHQFKTLVACCPPEKFKVLHVFAPLQEQFVAIVDIMRNELFVDKPPLEDRFEAMQKLEGRIVIMRGILEHAITSKVFTPEEVKALHSAYAQFVATIFASKEFLQSTRPS